MTPRSSPSIWRKSFPRGLTLDRSLRDSLDDLDGTFTYLVSTKDGLGYAKDQWSAKPLVTMETEDVVAIASEEVALRSVFSEEIDRVEAPAKRGHDLVDLDASQMTTRQLNLRLRELAKNGADITILNPQARHNIAVGILQCCKITVKGSVGYYAASLLDGPEVTVEGNAGWALGENMMAGKIVVTKDAGASVAATIRGGEVFVGGNAGARAGISMKGGTLVVKGNAGFLTGFMMQKGRIIVCGDVGEAAGTRCTRALSTWRAESAPLAVTPRSRISVRMSSSASEMRWRNTASM